VLGLCFKNVQKQIAKIRNTFFHFSDFVEGGLMK